MSLFRWEEGGKRLRSKELWGNRTRVAASGIFRLVPPIVRPQLCFISTPKQIFFYRAKTRQNFAIRRAGLGLCQHAAPLLPPGLLGPICDGNGCRSCILSAHSTLTSNQLEPWWMTETPLAPTAMTKMLPFSEPSIRLSSLHTAPPSSSPSSSSPFSPIALITLVQLPMLELKMRACLCGFLSRHHLTFPFDFISVGSGKSAEGSEQIKNALPLDFSALY